MKKFIFLLTAIFSLVACSSPKKIAYNTLEKWNIKRIIKEDLKKLGSDLDSMTKNKYHLEEKFEKSI